jgi:iron complex outermembrane receptor protein
MNSIKHATAQWMSVLMAATVAVGLGSQFARAGEPASPQQAVEQKPNRAPMLREIIVTAESRSQSLQDAPLAVTAITGATLRDMGAWDFHDYARTVPGLSFTDLGGGRQELGLRGINPDAGGLETVNYYVNDTPIPGIELNTPGVPIDPVLIDMNRIEVLRGPQGTLYGAGSLGGTIRVITNSPNLTRLEGSVEARALVTQGADGASPGSQEDFVLNLPIAKKLAAVRIVLWDRDIGGFINRTWTNSGTLGIATGPVVGTVGNLPDEHTWGTRAILLFEPIPRLRVSAMVFVQHQHYDGFSDITGGTGNPNDQLVQQFISDVPEPQTNDFNVYNLTVKYRFGRFRLVSATSYVHRYQSTSEESTSLIQLVPTFFGEPAFSGTFPIANLPAFVEAGTFIQRARSVSQETRLITTKPIAGFDAVLGVYYSESHDPRRYYSIVPGYDQFVTGNNPTNPAYAPNNNLYTATGPGFHQHQIAAFSQLTYHLTRALALIFGVRHFDVANRFQLDQSGLFISGNVPAGPQITDESSSARGTVYKGTISYKVRPDKMVYAAFSEGFRPGFGIEPPSSSICPSSIARKTEVNPDSIESYSLGAKTTWLRDRLMVDSSVYRINWSDIQQTFLLPCGFGVASNFGAAVIKGAELELRALLTNRINAGLSATYLHTELLNGSAASGSLPGDPIEYDPNWQYSLYAQATFPIFRANDGIARIDYEYTGHSIANYSRLADGGFNPIGEVQVTRLLNSKIGERYHAWEFALTVKNLLNTEARQSLDPNASITVAIPGRPRYVINRPRTFSLSATYRF